MTFVIKISEILCRTASLMSQNGMENSNVFIKISEVKTNLINLDNYIYNLKMA